MIELPNRKCYGPNYQPWLVGEFKDVFDSVKKLTLLDDERLHTLWSVAKTVLCLGGEMWECGVYKGGSARVISKAVPEGVLRLFDTFEGIPNADKSVDTHQNGDFGDTSVEAVEILIDRDDGLFIHVGKIPDTFETMGDSRISMAHVDVDTYKSVIDCCEFIWPRLLVGGVMVFDDYGFPTCPGARKAVDEFFESKSAFPIILRNGQAVVIRSMGV